MTAEERLNRAFAAAYGDPNHALAPVVTEMMHLASAIRAAEDEALERAAATLDRANAVCGDHEGLCLFCAQRRRDARVIRSLKSKEGK